MSRAHSVGLDHFVFAYLGIHDPYYADQSMFPNPPFGIFVVQQVKAFPSVNATRRDLASPEAEWPPDREFLLGDDACLLSDYQSRNDSRHSADFWHYWGAPKYWYTDDYARRHWEWTIEFHYRDILPIGSFHAILWPEELRAIGSGRHTFSLTDSEVYEFKMSHTGCAVVPYRWSAAEATISFVRASYAVARYYLLTGTYPIHADDAWELLRDEA